MDIIDAHCHMWRLEVAQRTWLTPDFQPLRRTFDAQHFAAASHELQVKQCVLVEAGQTEGDNRALQQMAESDIVAAFIPFANLEDPELEHRLDRWQVHPKFRGVRMGFEGHADPYVLQRPAILRGLAILAERKVIFEFLVRSHHLRDLGSIAERIPDLKAVIEHMAKPDLARGGDDPAWFEQMRCLAEETSLYCKLSFSPRLEQLGDVLLNPGSGWMVDCLEGYVQFLMETFGADRLLWGSDWPVALLYADYRATYEAMRGALGNMSSQDESKMFHDTAARFYGIANA